VNQNRSIKILVWNVRGINSQGKWDALRDKIGESGASIIYLQETKRSNFDASYLKKLCPRNLSKFEFFPSDGASGGLIIIWNPAMFVGSLLSANAYSVTVKFICSLTGKSFGLTNIYGPSNGVEKATFINWLYNFDFTDLDDWLLAGDFNLIRSPENRNRVGGNLNDMMLFNDLIQHLDFKRLGFRVGISLGVICSTSLFLKSWTGFSLLLHGLCLT
jgi:exonuclease III